MDFTFQFHILLVLTMEFTTFTMFCRTVLNILIKGSNYTSSLFVVRNGSAYTTIWQMHSCKQFVCTT